MPYNVYKLCLDPLHGHDIYLTNTYKTTSRAVTYHRIAFI